MGFMLQALLQKNDVQAEIEAERCGDGVLRDYADGAFVRNVVTSGETALLLAFYHDEVEVVNPLGSRRGIHKLGQCPIMACQNF